MKFRYLCLPIIIGVLLGGAFLGELRASSWASTQRTKEEVSSSNAKQSKTKATEASAQSAPEKAVYTSEFVGPVYELPESSETN